MLASMVVWKTQLSRSDRWIENAAASILGAGEADRRGRESDDLWRRRVVARAALRVALGRHLDRPPGSLAFALGPGGKPELAGCAGGGEVSFSLSRGGECCLIAVSADGPVGIDIERMRDFPELPSLVRSRFAADEAEAILAASGERRLHSFYRCWTRKEACLKAVGRGIDAGGLESVEVSAGPRPELRSIHGERAGQWSLLDLELGDGLAGALATRSAGEAHSDRVVPTCLPLGTE